MAQNGMIVCDFNALLKAFDPLIMGEKRYIANLYDIWVKGAPTLDSIIRDPKHYNPEQDTSVKRVIPGSWLVPFLQEVSNARGIPLSIFEAQSTIGEL